MELTLDLPIRAGSAPDVEILGVTHDSRRVAPGDLFVAVAGARCDGRAYASQAAARGAAAVLGAGEAPAGLAVPWLSAADPRALLGPLAARVCRHPDRELAMIGVTGTNGKSTVVELVRAILEAAGRPTAAIGTLGYRFRELIFAAERTTPEASDLFRLLRSMRDAGAEAAAMEVSSHALRLHRVAGASFDVAIFTNLSRDHFDFHADFEDYFAVKARLFDHLKTGGRAVVNVDDAYGRRLADALPGVLTYGAAGQVSPLEVELDENGIRGALATPRGRLAIQTGLLGAYNLENVLAAVAGAEALGVGHAAVRRGLAAVRPLPGRLEPVVAGQQFPVLVDFAHTDAALAAALRSVRQLTGRRLLVVFGCGGDRDPGKRVLMGRVAGRLADRAIATSDNPRSEDPERILESVEQGLRESGAEGYEIVVDRRQAIRRAVALADSGWAVLVAGKGHEEMQIVGGRTLPFSDRAELTAALEERFGARTVE
ncbi:MAG: UDP-N-acetylmuramoyl-L-alanyl-D-glutamate--2,6-diaminopimelate ligase [Acidobacteriota bacterium]|nr:UDP-N-acetylmuramoyl-L-alanyl-D-glutamate--2,6-diaminopimelate ligase [Acidobacteriota bacterium]MDH3522002.1 UDP-N-acetylmuramoyl-L-alanyl-D-glutamate--2,6-diaminopimelate ligase [Acidobacteriota bacterium]